MFRELKALKGASRQGPAGFLGRSQGIVIRYCLFQAACSCDFFMHKNTSHLRSTPSAQPLTGIQCKWCHFTPTSAENPFCVDQLARNKLF
ncbi:hypothetical protein PAXRUDRAFT_830169 [Paxillus rubicundulus Ve08.2h10]|uniref:Uncharacterized protein n=1 Tax=Paxillus rubicundulus Ve08.2h10 TaxID=930991 RepID=A0A0D0E4L1_9AGAM|nr:hypothetical protein PAXRUDRAFT_830169 [Paxillus rubicundulus Ve08.2h10]